MPYMLPGPDWDPLRVLYSEGYGGVAPEMFLVGEEEHCPGDNPNNIRARGRAPFQGCIDMRQAHDILFEPAWWDRRAHNIRTWKTGAALEIALLDGILPVEAGFENRRSHVHENTLGRTNTAARTRLCELFPIPRSGHDAWPEYMRWFNMDTPEQYRKWVVRHRIPLLKALVVQPQVRFIICHGMGERVLFKQLFDTEDWGQFSVAHHMYAHIARIGNMRVAIIPNLGQGKPPFGTGHIPALIEAFQRYDQGLRRSQLEQGAS